MNKLVHFWPRWAWAPALAAACAARAERAPDAKPPPHLPAMLADESFASSMHVAMARMDEGMSVACTGDADRDFAAMMIPHHQGAVDMALVELRFGKDERLRRLAQGIIVEQRQEIALMQEILQGASK